MTVTTYIGYSIIYLMCIVWFRAPFSNGEIKWPVSGNGVRNSVAMETSFGYLLNDFLAFDIGPVHVPTGIILFGFLICLFVFLFFRTKTGMAITAAGANPTFARASGINVDKMRLTDMGLSLFWVLSVLSFIHRASASCRRTPHLCRWASSVLLPS